MKNIIIFLLAASLSGCVTAYSPWIPGATQIGDGDFTKGLLFIGGTAGSLWLMAAANPEGQQYYEMDSDRVLLNTIPLMLFTGIYLWNVFDGYETYLNRPNWSPPEPITPSLGQGKITANIEPIQEVQPEPEPVIPQEEIDSAIDFILANSELTYDSSKNRPVLLRGRNINEYTREILQELRAEDIFQLRNDIFAILELQEQERLRREEELRRFQEQEAERERAQAEAMQQYRLQVAAIIPERWQSTALSGRIAIDMTPEMVRLIIGLPLDVNRSVSRNSTREQWVYERIGQSPRRYSGTRYLPHVYRYVYFVNGRVSGWQE